MVKTFHHSDGLKCFFFFLNHLQQFESLPSFQSILLDYNFSKPRFLIGIEQSFQNGTLWLELIESVLHAAD